MRAGLTVGRGRCCSGVGGDDVVDDVVGDVVGLLWGCCGSTVRSVRSTVVGLLWVLWGLRERDMMYSRSRQGYQGHSLWLEGGVVGIRESRWMGG